MSRIFCQYTWIPDAMPTPVSPPISAWVDDDGNPSRQVIRFQTIAPTRAQRTRTRPRCADASVMSTMSCAIVCATAVPSSAPTRLKHAAISSATRGVRARVETEVAIAFAASWNPLVKSNPSAMTTTRTTRAIST